jgi:NAD(P)-dependent dehydrogenase (short-subunit alcohol dehydrogenase family)
VAGIAAYVASKFGVVGLTRAAALETADAGIRVNCICPPVVRTPMVEGFAPEVQAEMIGPHAIKRLAEPSEIADTVVWLCSDRASVVTGTVFANDLGTTAGVVPR